MPRFANASALVVALFVLACSEPPTAGPDASTDGSSPNGKADDMRDAGIDTTPVVDAGADTTTPEDTGFDAQGDAGDVDAEWVRLSLTDGTEVTGELVATYDTTRWWDPGEGLLYAFFNPANHAAYPNDRSFRFIEEARVNSIDPWQPREPIVSYRQFLRDRDIVFQRPPLEDVSFVITGNESYHLDENGFGDFAWDFEKTDDEGNWYTGQGTENTDFLVWDEPVYSGVAGEVIEVVESGPDNMPGSHPDHDEAINNLVGIALGGHFYAYYLHFREDGVAEGIEVGTRVEVGELLGRVGNSGVSLEPHMHVVLLWWDEQAQRSYSVPVEWHEVGVAQEATGPFERYEWWVPGSGEWLRP